MKKLNKDEISTKLKHHKGWSVKAGQLHREYKFEDFVHAFGFMATSAIAIDKLNHHPDWSNVYNRVTVNLSTHDAGGITKKDFALAKLLDGIARKLQ
jgi:4a-hydroxytetrahydrobiopterin dehydratase